MNDLPLHGRPVKPRVGLFVTCLVDLMRPSVGFAAVKLLEDAGCIVDAPVQTCCGQPAYNSGDRGTTRDLAMQVINTFHGYDYVVAPSGSCAGMIKAHYPELFEEDPNWRAKADVLAAKTYELTSFLVDVMKVTRVEAAFDGTVMDKQRAGDRVFDVNVDGVAQYGLIPDWIADMRIAAGPDGDQIIDDMSRGAEAYLQMWERARK